MDVIPRHTPDGGEVIYLSVRMAQEPYIIIDTLKKKIPRFSEKTVNQVTDVIMDMLEEWSKNEWCKNK